MSERIILSAIGIEKGFSDGKFQAYHVVGQDPQGNQYIIPFSTMQNFTESIEKALRRFYPIIAPPVDEEQADELAGTDSDVIDITPAEPTTELPVTEETPKES